MPAPHPRIGAHLATLNLFREPDGTVEITVADGSGAVMEMERVVTNGVRPIDYIEALIVEAAANMVMRVATR